MTVKSPPVLAVRDVLASALALFRENPSRVVTGNPATFSVPRFPDRYAAPGVASRRILHRAAPGSRWVLRLAHLTSFASPLGLGCRIRGVRRGWLLYITVRS